MSWWQVVVDADTVGAADPELVADRLWLAGAASIEERPDGSLAAGFDEETAAVAAAAEVGGRAEPITSDEWLDAWRAHARPLRVGHLVVQPVWVTPLPDGPGDVVVELDPGRAFGDGAHPTTRTMLEQVVARVRPGDRVLDAGCGSGVLAVAAVLLGAASAVAVDIDADAVRITQSNAEANGVAGRVDASTTPIADITGPFDLVLANIGANALIELAPALADLVRPGGALVLSGVLAPRGDEVVAAYLTDGCVEVAPRPVDGDWVSPVLVRPH
jgi:ribosomal protein L11 methyltransferase